MNSKQGNRYIKNRMGDELKNKILEHSGIKLTTSSRTISVQRTCGKCNYVNSLESKYCERNGCNYPLTQAALDEIKQHEDSRMNTIIDERLRDKDEEIQALKASFKYYDGKVKEVFGMVEDQIEQQKRERQFFKNQFEAYRAEFGPRHLTKYELEKVKLLEAQLDEQLRNNPDNDDTYDAD